jgi:hypothetical protein
MKHIAVGILMILLCSGLVSCGKLSGQFAYKTEVMDAYRQMPDDMEFASDKPVGWVFAFDSIRGVHHIHVVLQKKELVWVDIKKETLEADKLGPYVHGKIENLDPGDYKVVLAEKGKLIAEKQFVVYGPDDAGMENDEE